MPTASAVHSGHDLDEAPTVQRALSVLAPKWTLWTLRTLQHNGGAMPLALLQEAMPWVSYSNVANRVSVMADDGLLHKVYDGRSSSAVLTAAGRSTDAVRQAAAAWGHKHRPAATKQASTTYAEQTLSILAKSYTTAVMWSLGPDTLYPYEMSDVVPPTRAPAQLYLRLNALRDDGLVERSGEPRHYAYTLTSSGAALDDTYDALTQWSRAHLVAPSASRRTPPPSQTVSRDVAAAAARTSPAPSAPTDSPVQRAMGRAQAAALRSATTRLEFSHRPAPQPAPLIVNGAPAPRRR